MRYLLTIAAFCIALGVAPAAAAAGAPPADGFGGRRRRRGGAGAADGAPDRSCGSADPTAWSAEVRSGIESFGVDPERANNLAADTSPGIPPRCTAWDRSRPTCNSARWSPAVDQLLMGLRAAWLCRSEALWAELAAESARLRVWATAICAGWRKAGRRWGPWDSLMLRATDELYRDAFLGDASWDELAPATTCRSSSTPSSAARSTSCWRCWPTASACSTDERFDDRLPEDVEPHHATGRADSRAPRHRAAGTASARHLVGRGPRPARSRRFG